MTCESGCDCDSRIIDAWDKRPVSVSAMANFEVGTNPSRAAGEEGYRLRCCPIPCRLPCPARPSRRMWHSAPAQVPAWVGVSAACMSEDPHSYPVLAVPHPADVLQQLHYRLRALTPDAKTGIFLPMPYHRPAQVSQHSECVLQVVTQGPARGSSTTQCPEDPTKPCRGSKFKIMGIVVGGVEGA